MDAQLSLFAEPPPSLDTVLAEVKARTEKRHPRYYKPLPPAHARVAREHYAAGVPLPEGGLDGVEFRTPTGLLLATGYRRLVIGDYGAYLEFTPAQMRTRLLRDRFSSAPRRVVKYFWKEPTDGSGVKVYFQVGAVAYADYLPGYYYVTPDELRFQV